MADISSLKICKNCKNVYSIQVGGMSASTTTCPVCKSPSRESVSDNT